MLPKPPGIDRDVGDFLGLMGIEPARALTDEEKIDHDIKTYGTAMTRVDDDGTVRHVPLREHFKVRKGLDQPKPWPQHQRNPE